MSISPDTRRFVRLCVPLTGFAEFDLHGTGMARLYLDTARAQVGEEHFTQFLDGWETVLGDGKSAEVLPPTHLEIARAVTYLWYTGAWPRLAPAAHADLRREKANVEFVVASSAYVEGLVWRTFHGHPVGAKPPGYGTWRVQPPPLRTLAELIVDAGLFEGEAPDVQVPDEPVAAPATKLPGPLLARGTAPTSVPTAYDSQGDDG